MKYIINQLKTLVAIVVVLTAVFASHYIMFWAGNKYGKRKMAKHIQEIRRVTRLDALAPRNH